MKVVSWLPLDYVAQATLDIAFCKVPPPPVLNIFHPKPVDWDLMVTGILQAAESNNRSSRNRLRLVPFSEWVSLLEQRAPDATREELKAMVSPVTSLTVYCG